MKIVYKKRFLKQFKRLSPSRKAAVVAAVDLLRQNPADPMLHNHVLKGKTKGRRAISAGFDLRIIFIVEGDYIVVTMLGVGTHEQVY